ncbi:LysR substrate-binding domain-containing protein [Paracoccus sp. IB05]|uniref:LysR substrate-binding domain-containing protein n=1 Tax=Paracoccus sp. IB05 TaxID=2779367 RepID=UPI0018E79CC2|nr:LysR substrate-binding domain-containing protein [Paracoccus sp. IB05]MBJ2153825.1 LysR family transcriptional regulator [Paracoccus sp. IB05]
MKLRDLEYLVALADHRNFHRAAEICHVSQPTLSGQIRKLEEMLGFDLFERAPRNLLITDAGREVLTHARRVLAEIGHIRDISASRAKGGAQRLRLGVFPTLGPYFLPCLVPAFVARFPRTELILQEAKSSQLIRQLVDGQLDAALLALPVSEPGLTGLSLFSEPFRLAVPAAHPLAGRKRISAAEMSGQRLMLLESGHCLRDQALDLCRISGAEEVDDFRGTSLETLRQMVIAGMGMTLLPRLACTGSGGLSCIAIADPGFVRRIGLFWRKSNSRIEVMNSLGDLIADTARGQGLRLDDTA